MGGQEKIFYSTRPFTVTRAYDSTTVLTPVLPDSDLNTEYNATLVGYAIDKSNLTWTVSGGDFPPGLTLSADGHISGTATTPGEYTFGVKATAKNGTFDSKSYTISVAKVETAGMLELSVTPDSLFCGAVTDYHCVLKPPVTGTPISGTSVKVTTGGEFGLGSAVTVTKPSSGVTAAIGNYGDITLTFDGNTPITEEGVEFTVTNVQNPSGDFLYCNAYMNGDNNYIWETESVKAETASAYTNVGLINGDSVYVTINDYDRYKDMDMQLSVITSDDTSRTNVYDQKVVLNGINIEKDEEFTVKLEVRDSLWNWYPYYESETLRGDGLGNAITITPTPPAVEPMKKYTIAKKVGGESNPTADNLYISLYKDGSRINYNSDRNVWLPDTENLTANASLTNLGGYDSTADVTVTDNVITVDFPRLEQTASVSGRVTSGGNPLPGAAVVASNTVNGVTTTYAAVTKADGTYEIENLYNGKEAYLTVFLDGYEEMSATVSPNPTATQDFTLTKTGQIIVNMDDGGSVTSPKFKILDGTSEIAFRSFSGGTSFALDLPADADLTENKMYTVEMTSEDTDGTAVGTAAMGADTTSRVMLSPKRLGYLSWDNAESSALYMVLVYKDGEFYKGFGCHDMSAALPEGSYTVYLTEGYGRDDTSPSETVTITEGETTQITVRPPQKVSTVRASVSAPKTAQKGKYYEISGVVESEKDADGKEFHGFTASMSEGVSVLGYKINGSYVGLSEGDRQRWAEVNKFYAPGEYPYVNWDFPLSYTMYVKQNADIGASQSVSMIAEYGYGADSYVIGSVVTKSIPEISINCPAEIAARTVTENIGGDDIEVTKPDAVTLSGTAPADSNIRIFDNDTLVSIARSDNKGKYSVTAFPASSSNTHTFRAETYINGTENIASEEKTATFNPGAPILKKLWLNDGELSLTGGSVAYFPSRNGNYSYSAQIENDDKLEEFTLNRAVSDDEVEEVTGKVFFVAQTANDSFILTANKHPITGMWVSEKFGGSGDDPLRVKVLYCGGDSKTAPDVTIDEESSDKISVDRAYEAGVKNDETINWDNKSDFLSLLGLTQGDAVTDDQGVPDDGEWENFDDCIVPDSVSLSGADDMFNTMSLMASTKSTSDLFESLASQMNEKAEVSSDPNTDGIKEITTLSTTGAASQSSDNYYEQRTWNDSPSWTKSGVKWRTEELRSDGYEFNAITDRDSGNSYLYFHNTLYYDKYGEPVANPSSRGFDRNGKVGTIWNERLFLNGKMVGSTLDVTYLYDVKAGKWIRTQSAIIPPKVTSPIHTAADQIPSTKMRPARYTPASELSSVGDMSLMASGRRTGGLSIKIRFDKISSKTYASAACSIGSFGVGKIVSKGAELKYVDIDNAKWGKYSLSVEENIASGSTITGSNMITGGFEGTSAPQMPNDILGLRKLLEANYGYYANIYKNGTGTYKVHGEIGKRRTKELIESFEDLEYAIEMAGIQDTFTNNVTKQLAIASGFIGTFGGPVGAEGALAADLISVLVNAANDTNNEEVKAAIQKFKKDYDSYMAEDSSMKDHMKKSEDEKKKFNNDTGFPIYDTDDDVYNDPFDDGSTTEPTAQTTPVHDPSGVVYEGVIENPIEGATVTLYKYDEDSGIPVQYDMTKYMEQQNPLTTDEEGYYRWDVPEGEWFVTAAKEGYAPGNSGNDIAATKAHTVGGEIIKFMPVLPPQLNVNIPLVDTTAPEVTDIKYTPGGVYVTFSKYMVDMGSGSDSVLNTGNYTLSDELGQVTDFTVERAVWGHAPSNVDSNETTYTKTVLIKPTEKELMGDVSVSVSGAVKSYAGTAVGSGYKQSGKVTEEEEEFAVTYETNGASVKNTSLVGANATVIVADYDEKGVLLRVNPQETSFGSLEKKTFNYGIGTTHQIFIWNSLEGMKPLRVIE